MSYLRISLMQPRQESGQELRRMHEDLLHHFTTLPGFINGYLMSTSDGTGRVGRVTVWESADHADQAAQDHHVLVVRSEMHRHIQDEADGRLEQGFEATQPWEQGL